jgi:hypothetical protein
VPQLYRAQTFLCETEVQWNGVRFLRFGLDPAGSGVDACHFQVGCSFAGLQYTASGRGIEGAASGGRLSKVGCWLACGDA